MKNEGYGMDPLESRDVRGGWPLRLERWLLAGAGCALLILSACAPQMKALTRAGAAAPAAVQCGQCHVEIYKEWHASRHAAAFNDPAYTSETQNHTMDSCVPCHAPETLFAPAPELAARASRREEGVSCLACHLIQGSHHGPFLAGALTPHATREDPARYRDAALCGRCHEGAYTSWQASHAANPGAKTCQQCHMPPVRRKLTQATGLLSTGIVALHEERDLRRHTFCVPGLPAGEAIAVAVTSETTPGRPPVAVVRVRNLLPHAIPEGDYGSPAAEIQVQALDGAGQSLASVTRACQKEASTQLDPGGQVELRLPLPAPAKALRVRLRRLRESAPAGGEVITEETRPVSPA